jgi:hypothetical protein
LKAKDTENKLEEEKKMCMEKCELLQIDQAIFFFLNILGDQRRKKKQFAQSLIYTIN